MPEEVDSPESLILKKVLLLGGGPDSVLFIPTLGEGKTELLHAFHFRPLSTPKPLKCGLNDVADAQDAITAIKAYSKEAAEGKAENNPMGMLRLKVSGQVVFDAAATVLEVTGSVGFCTKTDYLASVLFKDVKMYSIATAPGLDELVKQYAPILAASKNQKNLRSKFVASNCKAGEDGVGHIVIGFIEEKYTGSSNDITITHESVLGGNADASVPAAGGGSLSANKGRMLEAMFPAVVGGTFAAEFRAVHLRRRRDNIEVVGEPFTIDNLKSKELKKAFIEAMPQLLPMKQRLKLAAVKAVENFSGVFRKVGRDIMDVEDDPNNERLTNGRGMRAVNVESNQIIQPPGDDAIDEDTKPAAVNVESSDMAIETVSADHNSGPYSEFFCLKPPEVWSDSKNYIGWVSDSKFLQLREGLKNGEDVLFLGVPICSLATIKKFDLSAYLPVFFNENNVMENKVPSYVICYKTGHEGLEDHYCIRPVMNVEDNGYFLSALDDKWKVLESLVRVDESDISLQNDLEGIGYHALADGAGWLPSIDGAIVMGRHELIPGGAVSGTGLKDGYVIENEDGILVRVGESDGAGDDIAVGGSAGIDSNSADEDEPIVGVLNEDYTPDGQGGVSRDVTETPGRKEIKKQRFD